MTKKYRVKWCETVEYYTDIWADDEDTALYLFRYLPMDEIPIKETGHATGIEMDTVRVEEQ